MWVHSADTSKGLHVADANLYNIARCTAFVKPAHSVESQVDEGLGFSPFNDRSREMNLERIGVLLVEDNPGDARLFKELLRDAGANNLRMVQVNRLAAALDRLNCDSF